MTTEHDLVAEATEDLDAAPPERTTTEIANSTLPVRADSTPAAAAAVPTTIPGSDSPIVPAANELAQLAQLAVTIAGAKTAPAALRNNPNDAFMILLTARDVGASLTTAVREFHVIDGKVTLSPKVKLAMVKNRKLGKVWPHQPPRKQLIDGEYVTVLCPCGEDGPGNSDQSATWHAERADEPGILHSSTFTLEMARRVNARENNKNINLAEKSTWKQYPQRMLSWRALGYLLDDVYPDVGTGIYSPDEMGAVTDEDGNPIIDVIWSAQPVQGTNAPAGHRQRQQQQAAPDASDEQKAELKARIDAIAAHAQDARTALVQLWTAKREDGSPALPPLDRLKASHVAKASAMIDSIEARISKGEWGTADGDDGSVGDASSSEDQQTSPDAPSDAQGSESDDATDDDGLVNEIIAEVKAMTKADIVKKLDELGLATTGNADTVRRRLAEQMLSDRAGR